MDRWLPRIVIAGAIAILIFSSMLVPRLRSANPQDRDVLIQVLGGTADFAAEKAYHEAEVYFHAGFDTECPDEQPDHHVHHEVKASDSVQLPLLKLIEHLHGETAPRIHKHLKGNEEKELLPWFIAAVRLNPHYIDAWRVGSYWFYRTDNAHRAVDFVSDGIRRNPDDYRLYLDRGILYHRIREWDSAITDLETARRLWKEYDVDSLYELRAIRTYLRDCRAHEQVMSDK